MDEWVGWWVGAVSISIYFFGITEDDGSACVRACVLECMRTCVRACLRVCVCVRVYVIKCNHD